MFFSGSIKMLLPILQWNQCSTGALSPHVDQRREQRRSFDENWIVDHIKLGMAIAFAGHGPRRHKSVGDSLKLDMAPHLGAAPTADGRGASAPLDKQFGFAHEHNVAMGDATPVHICLRRREQRHLEARMDSDGREHRAAQATPGRMSIREAFGQAICRPSG